MLYSADYNILSDKFSVYLLKTIDDLKLKNIDISRHAASFKIDFLKFSIL